MMAKRLKETTMDPKKRTLLHVVIPEKERKRPPIASSGSGASGAEARFGDSQGRAAFRASAGCVRRHAFTVRPTT